MAKFNRLARTPKPDAAATPDAESKSEKASALGPEGVSAVNALAPKALSNISRVVDLLRRKQGAMLTDIVATTGWQRHTVRAALTGLKKKGYAIESRRADKQTTYYLA